jgi:hypothetical protein
VITAPPTPRPRPRPRPRHQQPTPRLGAVSCDGQLWINHRDLLALLAYTPPAATPETGRPLKTYRDAVLAAVTQAGRELDLSQDVGLRLANCEDKHRIATRAMADWCTRPLAIALVTAFLSGFTSLLSGAISTTNTWDARLVAALSGLMSISFFVYVAGYYRGLRKGLRTWADSLAPLDRDRPLAEPGKTTPSTSLAAPPGSPFVPSTGVTRAGIEQQPPPGGSGAIANRPHPRVPPQ